MGTSRRGKLSRNEAQRSSAANDGVVTRPKCADDETRLLDAVVRGAQIQR